MDVTDKSFQEEVIEASFKKPVVVDFWAPWCGPCQMLGPIMEEVAEEYKDKVEIVKLDVQDNQEVASVYGIMSIPAVKMFKDGKIVSEFLGAKPASAVKEWIDESL
ncbi:thioredoxin [archaeon]|nr:thioredoxin [archaeon]